MCALNVSSWQDKQLDELADMLKSADHSLVAAFIAENFLCVGSRIMTDPTATTLRVTPNIGDPKAVDLSSGVFQHAAKISHVESAQTINILNTVVGTWGTGQAAHATLNRWSIICVKNNERLHTPELRWFVDDSVDPNTYSQQNVNTLIDKAYYDITVVHGVDGAVPVVPSAPAGYWTIAEVYVPAAAVSILLANIYDTASALGSQHVPPNWTTTTRVLRLEFGSSMFGVDHSTATGYHKQGDWHIGTEKIEVWGTELNDALYGGTVGARIHELEATVTAKNLNTLTNGDDASGLHTHGGGLVNSQTVSAMTSWVMPQAVWTDIDSMVINMSGPSSLLLMFTAYIELHGSSWPFLRFSITPPAGPTVYEPAGNGWKMFNSASGEWNWQTYTIHHLYAIAAGAHVIKVQGARNFPYSGHGTAPSAVSTMIERRFSIIKIG